MQIGFGNGVFYRIQKEKFIRFTDKIFDSLKFNEDITAIELQCLDQEMLDFILKHDLKISQFDHISMHSPDINYCKNKKSAEILSRINDVCQKYNIKNCVVHPTKLTNWDVLDKYQRIPVSVENMDNKKDFGRSISDIGKILDNYNFGLTLDLQHCYVNDPSMELAKELHARHGRKIVEYHLSGFDKKFSHYPLYKTRQDIIIKNLKYWEEAPIIIESTFNDYGEQKKELEYIVDTYKMFHVEHYDEKKI